MITPTWFGQISEERSLSMAVSNSEKIVHLRSDLENRGGEWRFGKSTGSRRIGDVIEGGPEDVY
jgi:hypothetical protein